VEQRGGFPYVLEVPDEDLPVSLSPRDMMASSRKHPPRSCGHDHNSRPEPAGER
jgi:hypothetical protein